MDTAMADLIKNWLLDPTALLFIVSLLVVVYLWRRSAVRSSKRLHRSPLILVCGWLLICLICSSPTVVNPLLTTLEGRYPDTHTCPAGSHIVVLSGGVDSRAESSEHFERMSVATMARATQAWRLATADSAVRLIVAGGAIGQVTEADVVSSYWAAMGLGSERILKDDQSSNTRENALNVLALLESETISGPVRLITSALHMPRALGSFEKVFADTDITFCKVSVDRQALVDFPLWSWLPQTTALVKFDKWLHEVVALLLYHQRGWI